MLDKLKKIYLLIPIPISKIIIDLFKLNPYFSKKTWKEIENINQDYNNFDILNFNIEILKKIVKRNEYYKNFNMDLQNYPLLDTNDLRENFEKIINKDIKGYMTSTGGTGRNPSKLYLSNKSYKKDIYHVVWAWSKLGYKIGDKKLTLRGTNLGKKLYKYNPIYDELQINIFLMNENNIDLILKEIEKYNPNFGHGYPSAFVRFSQLIKNKKINFKLKGISLASEGFNSKQREIIENTFKCPARGFFGHSERACFANEKIKEKGIYEVLLTYGLIEIIKENGERASLNEEGEIVCTGFINEAMPLIRYKTGDYATVNKIANGIVMEIKDIKGRWGKDFIYDKNSNPISTTAINIHSDIQYDFRYIQLYQKEKGKLIIKLVPWKQTVDLQFKTQKILEDFQKKLSEIEIKCIVIKEEEIYRTYRGKIPYLVNELINMEKK